MKNKNIANDLDLLVEDAVYEAILNDLESDVNKNIIPVEIKKINIKNYIKLNINKCKLGFLLNKIYSIK